MAYNSTPAATARFNELTRPDIGMHTVTSQAAIYSGDNPFCSLPNSRMVFLA
jgi:hypothetical protein